MMCTPLERHCSCDGTFLSSQANGHVSQDQEEVGDLESTARAPAEDETQVGPQLGSVPLFFHSQHTARSAFQTSLYGWLVCE